MRPLFSLLEKKIDRRVNVKGKDLTAPGVIPACVLAALVVLLTAEMSLAQSFVWPMATHPIGRNYEFVASLQKWHTGVDIGDGNYSYTTTVMAVQEGTVHKIFGIYGLPSSSNLRRWNSSNGAYSWSAQPTTDWLGRAYGTDNHGLGICVIIYHPHLQIYTLYGHLDAVVAGLSPGQSVSAGTPIGKMGNSYKQYLRRSPTADGVKRVAPGRDTTIRLNSGLNSLTHRHPSFSWKKKSTIWRSI